MGEAARRRRLGFDGPGMGEAALAALNDEAGGRVWALARGASIPDTFLVLDAEGPEVSTARITNAQAAETPHRVVALVLVRRGEPWLEAMVFDSCEEYRPALYNAMAGNALRTVLGVVNDERVDEVWHEIVTTTWREAKTRTILTPGNPAADALP